MSDPEAQKGEAPASPEDKSKNGPGYRDLAALGIGCLIFVIFFAAIVIAAMTRE